MSNNPITGVVLAGGYATRFWPVTKERAKVLLPLDLETAVMDKQIREMDRDARVDEIYVSTNAKFAGDISNHVSEQDYETPTVSVEQTTEENEKLGVVGALEQFVRREGLENENLLIVAGDNVMSMNLSDVIDRYETVENPFVISYDIQDEEQASSYGVVNAGEDGEVHSFEEKPDNPSSTLVSTACYLIPSEYVMFQEYLAEDNNPDEPGWYMQWLQNNTSVYTHSFEGEWFDIGTPRNYVEAVKWWLDGDNIVSDNAEIVNSKLEGNNLILPNSTVENSVISDSVVFEDCELSGCKVEDSIIDSELDLRDLEMDNSFLGNRRFR